MWRLLSLLLLGCLVLPAVAQTAFCADGIKTYETLVDEIASPFALQIVQLPKDSQQDEVSC